MCSTIFLVSKVSIKFLHYYTQNKARRIVNVYELMNEFQVSKYIFFIKSICYVIRKYCVSLFKLMFYRSSNSRPFQQTK